MKKILLVFLALLLFPVLANAGVVGKITGLKGVVQFRAKNNLIYSPLKNDEKINEGNWIKTGQDGWVELTLTDKSRFTLANNTEFEVTSFLANHEKREGVFKLVQGKLRASVVKVAGKQSGMIVRSGTAVAGIKGTEFLMLSQGPANVFFGNEGVVAVSGDGQNGNQALESGSMTQNTRSVAPVELLQIKAGTPLSDAKVIFENVTAANPPAQWTDSGKISEIIARWNINHASYLADSGRYNDALQIFQIALDLTENGDIRADAYMARGAVYARYLGNSELALAEYLLVLEEYPKQHQAETALFNCAQTLLELGFMDQAKVRFQQYLRKYPKGKHLGNVETFLNNIVK